MPSVPAKRGSGVGSGVAVGGAGVFGMVGMGVFSAETPLSSLPVQATNNKPTTTKNNKRRIINPPQFNKKGHTVRIPLVKLRQARFIGRRPAARRFISGRSVIADLWSPIFGHPSRPKRVLKKC
jgi:hypothetical protein